jgi:hypothetical protein
MEIGKDDEVHDECDDHEDDSHELKIRLEIHKICLQVLQNDEKICHSHEHLNDEVLVHE